MSFEKIVVKEDPCDKYFHLLQQCFQIMQKQVSSFGLYLIKSATSTWESLNICHKVKS